MQLIRSLWRILPNPTRRALSEILLRFNLARAYDIRGLRPLKTYTGRKVAVAGIYQTATGMGKAAELVAQTLEAGGTEVIRVDLTAALGIPIVAAHDYVTPARCQNLSISDLVVVLNPGLRHPLQAFELQWLKDRCIIGHWIWELERLPRSWAQFVKSFDEVWVPTDYVRDAVLGSIPGINPPPKVVPYCISNCLVDDVGKSAGRLERNRLGIQQDAFVVGYSFAVGSNYFRKNPEGVIDAFLIAFPDRSDQSVCLIVRCRDLDQHPTARHWLTTKIAGDPRILVLDHKRSGSIADFYATINLYAAPFRAEGFGLNLVEAAQQGMPVLATGWRLPQEVASMPNVTSLPFHLIAVKDPQGHYNGVKGAQWAQPDIAVFAQHLLMHRRAFVENSDDVTRRDVAVYEPGQSPG